MFFFENNFFLFNLLRNSILDIVKKNVKFIFLEDRKLKENSSYI